MSLKKTQSENCGQTLTINEEKKGTSFIGNSSVGVKKIHWQKIICCFFNLMKDKNVSNHEKVISYKTLNKH